MTILDKLKDWLQGNSIIASAANNVRVVVLSDLIAQLNRLADQGTFDSPVANDPVIERDRLWCMAIVAKQYVSDCLKINVSELLAEVERLRGSALPVANEGGLMPSDDGLLPCPMCGNGAEFGRSEGVTGRKWHVRCKTVRCYLFLHNKETVFERKVEAKNDWNTRQTTGWRPMETAPKGEVDFILKCRHCKSGKEIHVVGHFEEDGFYMEDRSELSFNWTPVGWSYLPPTQGEKG